MAYAFLDVLRSLRRGEAVIEYGDRLREVVEQVQHTGKAGTFTVALTVKPVPGDAVQVSIAENINAKLPERDRVPTTMFIGEHGQLERTDPRQRELPLDIRPIKPVGGQE